LCGIAGFKPTQRRVPLDGALPLSPSLDSIGPLASTAACCAAVDAILAGTPERVLAAAELPGLRLLLPENFAFDHLDAATDRAFERAVLRLERAGALIDRRRLAAFDDITTANARGGFAATEAFAWHQDLLARAAARYDPRVATRIQPGGTMPAADYFRLMQARARIIADFAAEMAHYDAVIMPTVPIAPPRVSAFAEDAEYRRLNFLLLRNPSSINFLDGCAISVPCQDAGAPPAGLMLAGPAGTDARILAIGMGVEGILN
jgi:aspartyl-tRNA(Asn)/glutamyl-tRNA(Gln) amidotransferase subunit A